MSAIALSYEKVEAYIQEISAGGRLVSVLDSNNNTVDVYITHCVGTDIMRAGLEYDRAYNKAVSEGFLTIEDTRSLLRDKGVVDLSIGEKIKKLKLKLEAQEAYLVKLTRVPSRRATTIKNINRMKQELEGLYLSRDKGLEYTAERVASEERYLFITWLTTKTADLHTRFWLTKEDFKAERDIILRRNIFLESIKMQGGTDVSILRYLAQHSLWRIRYLASVKTGESLFGRPIFNYTIDQLGLVYWSNYYQSIYDMMPEDRPPSYIIEDDNALDAYMKAYTEEKDREATAAREKGKKGKGVSSAWEQGEVLVMRSNPVYEDVEYSDTIEAMRDKVSTDFKLKHKKNK